MSMRIDCVDSTTAISHLAPEWSALWRRCEATPFQSPEWLLAWWRSFGNEEPRLLTARKNGALAGVLPLYLRREPGLVKLLPLGIGISDYIDALVPPGCPDVAAALLSAIAGLPDWQECHLPDLPSEAALLSAPVPAGCDEERVTAEPCPVLVLPRSPDALNSVLPHKAWRDLRQARNRSEAAGIAIERADSETLDCMIDDLLRLHGKRWQSRGEAGVLAEPEVQRFHRRAARAMLCAGLLRLSRLRIGGKVAAVYYGFLSGGRAYAYLGGFDPELPRLSPGAQIIGHAIEEAIAEGASEFHFLRGDEAYKYAWGAGDRWNTARTFRR